MRLQFHPAAAEEYLAAIEYYEEALPGLGRRFHDAVRTTSEHALTHPESGSARRGVARHLIVPGFPYDLVYQVRGEVLEVLAVAHQRRRPGYWKDRR